MAKLAIKPAFMDNYPAWWNPHGFKIKLQTGATDSNRLVMQNGAARIMITKDKSSFVVLWALRYSPSEYVTGQIVMSLNEIRTAFGLRDWYSISSNWLIKRFGGSAAEQGKFIRYEKFLNIPGPGTGSDGDANISVFIDENIQKMIKQLTSSNE